MIEAENETVGGCCTCDATALLFRILLRPVLDTYIHTTIKLCLDCSQRSFFEQDGCLNHLCM